jgi:hypothetical protein
MCPSHTGRQVTSPAESARHQAPCHICRYISNGRHDGEAWRPAPPEFEWLRHLAGDTHRCADCGTFYRLEHADGTPSTCEGCPWFPRDGCTPHGPGKPWPDQRAIATLEERIPPFASGQSDESGIRLLRAHFRRDGAHRHLALPTAGHGRLSIVRSSPKRASSFGSVAFHPAGSSTSKESGWRDC